MDAMQLRGLLAGHAQLCATYSANAAKQRVITNMQVPSSHAARQCASLKSTCGGRDVRCCTSPLMSISTLQIPAGDHHEVDGAGGMRCSTELQVAIGLGWMTSSQAARRLQEAHMLGGCAFSLRSWLAHGRVPVSCQGILAAPASTL